MKIMIVTPYFYPKIGGLENYAWNIAKGLKEKGHDVFIVTSNHQEKKYVDEVVKSLRVIRLPVTVKLSNSPVGISWFFKLRKIIKSEQPDVINAHTPVPFISDMAAHAKGHTRFVLTYHNDLVKNNGLGKYLARVFYLLFINHTLRVSDTIIATSDYYAKESPYLKKYMEKVQIVSPGVDSKIFHTNVSAKTLKMKFKDKRVILFTANLDKTHSHKGLDVLIDAISLVRDKVKNVQLIVIGKGDDIPRYKQIVTDKGLDQVIKFTGYVPDDVYTQYLAIADVLALPSTTNAEGFGMVALEASACGVPVVATQVGGVPFIVRHKYNGLLVKPRKAKELAMALIEVIKSPEKAKEYGNNGVLMARDYAWSNKSDQTHEILAYTCRPRVCIIHNIVSPYRLPVFEKLNKEVNLTVLFCRPITKDRKWKFDLTKNTFKYQILRGFIIGPLIINTNILSSLRKTKFDIVIANNDPDVAHAAMCSFMYAKLNRRRIVGWSEVIDKNVHFYPAIAYGTTPFMKLLRTIIGNAIEFYRRINISFADHHIVLSKEAGRYLKGLDVQVSSITYVPQVMPVELLPKPAKAKRNGHTVLYVGYLTERKGVNYLIDGFMCLNDPRLRLIIAGSGPVLNTLREQASNDKRISFPGYVDEMDRANLYASADVFVLPTLTDVWGLVVNEAIHYGLAVVCTTAAVAREIVDDEAGILISPRSKEEIRDALLKLVSNQTLLKSMQKHNSSNTKMQDINVTVAKLTQAINAGLI